MMAKFVCKSCGKTEEAEQAPTCCNVPMEVKTEEQAAEQPQAPEEKTLEAAPEAFSEQTPEP